jgi:hypothetical protein
MEHMLTTTQSPQQAVNYWLGICRDHALIRGQMKMAELGGGQDTPFEQAFSNLAHAYIKDKAPKLLDFEVGFQLLEKNQENTKAVGVFGFKVGSQWIYVPVFFLNGDLKGHELLYIKSQDQFLPLKENWINHILGKKPAMLGDGVNRNLSQLGIMPPNLYQLSRSPSKFAEHIPQSVVRRSHTEPDPDVDAPEGGEVVRMSHDEADETTQDSEHIPAEKTGGLKIASWAKDFLPVLGYLTMVPPAHKYADMKGFADLIKEGGEDTLRYVVEKIGTTYPAVINGIDQIYGPELLTETARDIAKMKKAAAARSLVKTATLSSAGEHPKGWNGGIVEPSEENGGKMSTGRTAWDSSHKMDGGKSRRFEKKHGGAEKGHLKEMFKLSTYPGCGMRPKRPKKMKKKGNDRSQLFKTASIIPSILGPLEADDLKHKVVSREMVDNDPNIVHDMKSDERETLLKERHVFTDKRDNKDVTIAYDVQTPLKLTNPDHTGVYYVLTKPDKFEKCIVIMAPYSSKQRHNHATVIRFDGSPNYTNTHPVNIWVRAELDRDEWTKWWNSIDKVADSIPLAPKEKRWDYRTRYVLLGPSGQGTCPFMATEKYTGDKNSSIVYEVDWECHNYSSRPAYLPDHGERIRDPYMHGGEHTNCNQLVLTKRPGIKMTCLRGQLLVPSEFKLIKVKDEKNESESNNEPIQLGNLLDVQLAIMSNTQPIRIVLDGKDVKVDDERMDKESALVHLFRDHGLREKAARYLLKKAEKDGRVEARLAYPEYIQKQWDISEKEAGNFGPFGPDKAQSTPSKIPARLDKPRSMLDVMATEGTKVPSAPKPAVHPEVKKMLEDYFPGHGKQADNDMISGAPNAPGFPEPYYGYDPLTGGNVPTMQTSEFNQKIPDMSASKTDRSIYYPFGPDPKAMQVAQQASQSGQKEIFDTAMLGGLLKAVRQDNIVDKYMGDLKKGLDRLGRLLFLYYWHGEEFEDRYGKQDMPELEDGLRNGFENVGDIVLKLMQKTVEVSPDEGTGVDLGAVANQ